MGKIIQFSTQKSTTTAPDHTDSRDSRVCILLSVYSLLLQSENKEFQKPVEEALRRQNPDIDLHGWKTLFENMTGFNMKDRQVLIEHELKYG